MHNLLEDRMPTFARSILLILGVAVAVLFAPTPAAAQVIHLPPFFRPVVERGDTLLRVSLASRRQQNAPAIRIQVDDDRMIITEGDDAIDIIPLADRTIRDVVAEVSVKYRDKLTLRTDYPLHSTDFLGPMKTTAVMRDSIVNLPSSATLPQVDLGFGVVMSMPGRDSDVGNNLLSQTGFQLDLAGAFQLAGPGQPMIQDDGWFEWPLTYLRGRLALGADQQLQVETAEQGTTPSTGDQFGLALEQADQIALTAQFDVVFPIRPGRWDLVLTPSYGVSWTRLDPLPLPTTVRVGNANLPFLEVFTDEEAIARTRRQSQETLPLSEWGINGTFQFSRRGPPIFYFGGGLMKREFIRRGVRFRLVGDQPGGAPRPETLSALMDIQTDDVWRAMFGARIAGVLDVRLDASGPIGVRDREPLLRLVLGRSFPIVE